MQESDRTRVYELQGRVSHYANWLSVIPWQLFATLTFARPVGDARATQVFGGCVDRMEQYFRCPLVYVRGDERRFSGCGMPSIRRHFHVLFAAAVPLGPRVCSRYLDPDGRKPEERRGCGCSNLRSDRGALAYSLKQIFEIDGDWSFANLDLYLPNPGAHRSARTRRRLARHAKRALVADVVSFQPGQRRERTSTLDHVGTRPRMSAECGPRRGGPPLETAVRATYLILVPCLFCRHELLVS